MTRAPAPESAPRRTRLPPGILPVAVPVALFFAGSALFSARPGFARFARPVYARWRPGFDPPGILAIVAGASIAALAWRALRPARPDPVRLVAFAVLGMLAFAASAAAIDGGRAAFVEPLERDIDYAGDTHLVDVYGVRGFIEEYPRILPEVRSPHTRTHPPGPVVALAVLEDVFASPVSRAIVLAIASVLILVPAWWLARMMAGPRAAALSVMLLAVAPGAVLHTFVSLDAAIATVMVLVVALLVRAFATDADPRWAITAGLATGLLSFLTFAAGFLAVFGVLLALLSRPPRAAVRVLLPAAAGGLAALILLRIAVGFDLLATYTASNEVLTAGASHRSYWYWLFGSPAAWLAFAGLPAAGPAVRELLGRRPPYLVAMLVPLTVFYVVPPSLTGIIPGETERTLLFAVPLATAAAAAAWSRWETDPRSGARAAGVMVALTAAQAIVMEVVYAMYW